MIVRCPGGRGPPAHAPGLSFTAVRRAFLQFHSCCEWELAVLRCRTNKVPFVAGDVEKQGDVAVGSGARCREEPHAGRCHPRVRGVEVLDVEEETHPAGGLLPDDGGLVFSVSLWGARSLPGL